MVDYSKWKNIEISDDEDDTHPNIDTASLFRWRHQARLERMAEVNKEKEEIEKAKKENEKKAAEIRNKLQNPGEGIHMDQLKKELDTLEEEKSKILQKDTELAKRDKLTPWNVDTISSEGFTKTVLNKAQPRQKKDHMTEEERNEIQVKFVKENESLLKKFGMLRKFDDSKRFLQEHPNLTCEETANYLVIWCINLQMEEKLQLMEHVAHQCICMQYILELAKQLDVDPRSCVVSFFTRIQMADQQYREAFEDELKAFKERVRNRAQEKIEQATKELEEEEKQKRLGPGGLDPVEVFESLPKELQECFEKQDIPLLQKTIEQMSEEDARYHMKRCVDSGLWVPNTKAAQSEEEPEPK